MQVRCLKCEIINIDISKCIATIFQAHHRIKFNVSSNLLNRELIKLAQNITYIHREAGFSYWFWEVTTKPAKTASIISATASLCKYFSENKWMHKNNEAQDLDLRENK